LANDIAKFVTGFCFLEVSNNVDEFEQQLQQQYKIFLHFVNFQNRFGVTQKSLLPGL